MRYWILCLALVCAVTSAVLSEKVLGAIPHVPDELSYLYQARILATGNLWVEQPAVPEAFTVQWDHIVRDSGKWRAIYPPGWPLLLAAGWLIHATWIINPLLFGLSIPGIYLFAKRLFDERTAFLASIAFACSPFVLMMSAGFMAHPSTLFCVVWSSFFLVRGERKDYFFAGLAGAFAFAIRPYTAVPVLLPLLLWSLLKAREKRTALLQLVLGGGPILLLFGIYNYVLFHSVIHGGYAYDSAADFRGSPIHHFLSHIPWYFSNLNRSLWGWPWPDLLIFLPLLLPHQKWKSEIVLFLCFVSLLIAYSIFYFTDIVYGGPRYLYESMGFLAVLAARALRILEERLRLLRFLPILIFLYPLVITLPAFMDYYAQNYHGQSREFLDFVERKGIGRNALVLIGGDPNVFRTFVLENSLHPENSERVFARDIPEMRESIQKSYKRKEIWSMQIELTLYHGLNEYTDRATIRSVKFERLQ